MFKKLKDKLAEEVKSSPQRIQQFAQAAQAAVTSASSSISDITNSDLFSIGENDTPQNNPSRIQPSPSKQQNMFQDVNMQSTSDSFDYTQEMEPQRQRRLSNSSFASDVSFRLPSYETPSMYHLQSDMEVSASEADERGFSGGPTTLDRVTKEQLYAAYKRTQERYTKYRTQYGDLARHYKLLERENAKARSVLVETQDKALRRISELKEQCSLEQSAKAHLEKALRIEIEEKNMKIETLNTKIQLLQNNVQINESSNGNENSKNQINDNEALLINLSNDNAPIASNDESSVSESTNNLNNKIEKMEQLLNKYKESLKTSKEKNSQLTIELQKMSNDIENRNKHIQELINVNDQLNMAKQQIEELNTKNEDLQNQINTFDFNKTKEMSTLEMDLQKANEEIDKLRKKNDVFNKREEEYAISIAENKLSIHKELESKEAEIKSLKDSLGTSQKEIKSLKIVITDYKNNISVLEEEKLKLTTECSELTTMKAKYNEMVTQLQELNKKVTNLEQLKTKADEEYKCLQLQLKQETAEKMAIIDRNSYLENRKTQLSEENNKKSTQISSLEGDLKKLSIIRQNDNTIGQENDQLRQDVETWKEKCSNLESEIQEERIELVKLQAEIEKLLANHEQLQTQNVEFRSTVASLTMENSKLEQQFQTLKPAVKKIESQFKELRAYLSLTVNDIPVSLEKGKGDISSLTEEINKILTKSVTFLEKNVDSTAADYKKLTKNYENLQAELAVSNNKYLELIRDLDKLRDENNNLKENLNIYESENKSLNEKLIETAGIHKAGINETELLKQENEQLKKNLKDLNEISLQKETDLEDEKKRNNTILDQIKYMEESKQQAEIIIQELKHNISKLNEDLFKSIESLKDYTDKINHLTNENKELQHTISELQASLPDQSDVEHKNSQYLDALEQMKSMKTENQKLNDKMNNMELENKILADKIEEMNKELEVAENKISEMNAVLLNKSNELNKFQENQASLELEAAENLLRNEELVKLENDKTNLVFINKVKDLEDSNNLLKDKLKECIDSQKTDRDLINSFNNEIHSKSNEIDALVARIKQLDESILVLSEENILLKGESINFVSNIKKLETEIDDIKKSHSQMEIEKDHLNTIIENLEQKENNKTSDTKDTQTEEHADENSTTHEPTALLENKWLMQNKHSTMSHTASLNLTSNEQQDLSEEYGRLKSNYETLKDENRRLQSDIEGLQSYLTKISKENSVLNDKLREVIATSEQTVDDELSSDVKEMRNTLQSNKEKINDLLRENSLLIEENLELKDQLQSQNYHTVKETIDTTSVSNEKEIKNVKEKLENMLHKNVDLEKRNMSLEQINKSVNGNMMQLQEKNERLKLSNEKLERRLDEALVSLRHLHSLQENTELEYLRNILYEYLTGSGTHSVTLAKVLSAIVKFDDSQTQLVMQKEKERQGFLRQLGLL